MTTGASTTVMLHTYYLWGYHGGYVLAGPANTSQAIAAMAKLAEKRPAVFFNMDFEPYTLDRMANGPRLDLEKRMKGQRWRDRAALARLQKLADAGRLSIVSSYTQPFAFAVDGESLVRQIAYARQIARDTLGVEFDTYWAQEPCWFGQMPAVLSGFGFKGVYFCNSWAVFGGCPVHEGEKLRWRGPDGSVIMTIPRSRYASVEVESLPSDANRWDLWQHGVLPNRERIEYARSEGIEHPVFGTLGKDFFPANVKDPYEAIHVLDKDIPQLSGDMENVVQIEPVSLAKYIEAARDDGEWDDAFASFEPRMNWGSYGSYFLRDQRIAADRANLAERLAVLSGADWQRETDLMWQAAMLSQHHDFWALLMKAGGEFAGLDIAWCDVPGLCRREVEDRLARLTRRAPAARFTLANATERPRREWAAIDIEVPAGRFGDMVGVKDASGTIVPSRLARIQAEPGDKAAGGKADRVVGRFLADVPAFSCLRYAIVDRAQRIELPVSSSSVDGDRHDIGLTTHPTTVPRPIMQGPSGQVETGAPEPPVRRFELANDRLRVVAAADSIRVWLGQEEAISNIYLDGNIDGQYHRGSANAVSAEITPEGLSRARLAGSIGTIPFEMTLELAPWGEALDIYMAFDLNGQAAGGRTDYNLAGDLKVNIEYEHSAMHLSNQAFELRLPSWQEYFAVHYVLSEWNGNEEGYAPPGGEGIAIAPGIISGIGDVTGADEAGETPGEDPLLGPAGGAGSGEGGFVTLLDRPSGVIFDQKRISVALYHGGDYQYGYSDESGLVPARNRDVASGRLDYHLAIVPFGRGEKARATWQSQRELFPLTVLGKAPGESAPGIKFHGHSVVSALYRQGDDFVMRLWNPFNTEVARITAQGMTISTVNMELGQRKEQGKDYAEIFLRPMQIQTLLLTRHQPHE